MNESTIPVTVEHDGEYCGECQFLRYGIAHGYWCQIYINADLQRHNDDVKRCAECVEKAVPVKTEQKKKE